MRGLLAIEPMYRQIVAGNKTQTRRSGGLEDINIAPDDFEYMPPLGDSIRYYFENVFTNDIYLLLPRYKVGEVLYLKEPFKVVDAPVYIEYAFDKPNLTYEGRTISDFRGKGYANKLFMPADFGRAFIKITGIKCERLYDISESDCLAEGIEIIKPETKTHFAEYKNYNIDAIKYNKLTWSETKISFYSLYKFANKIKPTAEIPNIWVWAYTFEYLADYKR